MITISRLCYHIEGIVQGVGFRPFVYTLAKRFHLKGFVLNTAQGVLIDIEGPQEDLDAFEHALYNELPPLARMDICEKTKEPYVGYVTFEIKRSIQSPTKSTLIMPDMALCSQCEEEFFDPRNRRYHYVFTNCTNCGPRYSIIKTVPYDRPNTSMQPFEMCEVCQEEYTNPLNRRYHAQPISCPNCGPSIALYTIDGGCIAKDNEALSTLASLIHAGHIVALKGMGGFHLMCDATNDSVIKMLRERKNRPTKPFAVMFKTIEAIQENSQLDTAEYNALSSQLRPIVLVKPHASKPSILSPLVAPRIERLGVFLPYTPLHKMLFEFLNVPIVATSANRSGEPIIAEATYLCKKLSGVIDYYVDYNRDIVHCSDDSVMQFVYEKPLLMRLSRGLAPLSFRIKSENNRAILAIGAHQKNAIAIYLNHQIIVSPYIGDLDNVSTCLLFENMIRMFQDFYDFVPDLIIGDLHPHYYTTQWAKKQKCQFIQIQHHYAHILSAMCEHELDQKVLGIAWDGTGYGSDGTIWGGEFLVCDTHGFERVAFFEPFLLLGADASIKDTRRILVSMLWDLEQKGHCTKELVATILTPKESTKLRQIYDKKTHAPQCSSVGRIFDAVAIICGMDANVSYDGESGLFLESLYDASIDACYVVSYEEGVIGYKEMLPEMFNDKDPRVIATKFINTLVDIVGMVAKKYNFQVVLSGGVFQNRTLLEALLRKDANRYVLQHKLPPNDGGICVGQLYYALHNNA